MWSNNRGGLKFEVIFKTGFTVDIVLFVVLVEKKRTKNKINYKQTKKQSTTTTTNSVSLQGYIAKVFLWFPGVVLITYSSEYLEYNTVGKVLSYILLSKKISFE